MANCHCAILPEIAAALQLYPEAKDLLLDIRRCTVGNGMRTTVQVVPIDFIKRFISCPCNPALNNCETDTKSFGNSSLRATLPYTLDHLAAAVSLAAFLPSLSFQYRFSGIITDLHVLAHG